MSDESDFEKELETFAQGEYDDHVHHYECTREADLYKTGVTMGARWAWDSCHMTRSPGISDDVAILQGALKFKDAEIERLRKRVHELEVRIGYILDDPECDFYLEQARAALGEEKK